MLKRNIGLLFMLVFFSVGTNITPLLGNNKELADSKSRISELENNLKRCKESNIFCDKELNFAKNRAIFLLFSASLEKHCFGLREIIIANPKVFELKNVVIMGSIDKKVIIFQQHIKTIIEFISDDFYTFIQMPFTKHPTGSFIPNRERKSFKTSSEGIIISLKKISAILEKYINGEFQLKIRKKNKPAFKEQINKVKKLLNRSSNELDEILKKDKSLVETQTRLS